MVGYGSTDNQLRTVPYEASFLLFDSESTTFYKYGSAEEEFLPMPVKMSRAIGDAGTPIIVNLDNFPTSTSVMGKTLSFSPSITFSLRRIH